MKTADFIREHTTCCEGARWALSISDDMADVWDALVDQGRHEWLIWTVTRPGVLPDSVLRKLVCRFIRETPLHDGRMVWDLLEDERSRKAVEVAERYVDGKATKAELVAAAEAAESAVAVADAEAAAEAVAAASYLAAESASYFAAEAASYFAADAADAAYFDAYSGGDTVRIAAADAARSAQVQMIAELGNPFKKERVKQ